MGLTRTVALVSAQSTFALKSRLHHVNFNQLVFYLIIIYWL